MILSIEEHVLQVHSDLPNALYYLSRASTIISTQFPLFSLNQLTRTG
jgi:hypothetical protein